VTERLLPPFEPMLARLSRTLPCEAGTLYEPKWDGFRCVAFRNSGEVDLRSRNQRSLTRYFPEVADAVLGLTNEQVVLDGELMVRRDEQFDFAALMARIHPAASRVSHLADTTPAMFMAFDLVAIGTQILFDVEFRERRRRLERVVCPDDPVIALSPVTEDCEEARAWLDHPRAGIDGVVAKAATMRYEPGRRAMTKVKRERTADCVVAGFRLEAGGGGIRSLLLGLYGFDPATRGDAALHHFGVVSSLARGTREQLLRDLAPLVVPLRGHPWEHGFALEGGPAGRLKGAAGRWTPDLPRDWVPVRPVQVCEVAYDHADGHRLRHPARWRRWRPDRSPMSCTFAQLDDDFADR
jgi:ATP-dependent DNA ligase